MDFDSMAITMQQIEKIIAQQVQQLGIKRGKVFLAGYSQGAVTALWASTVLEPIGGILGLGGYLPSEAIVPSPLRTPVMMVNDKSDTIMQWTDQFCRKLAVEFKQKIENVDAENVDRWFWMYLFVDQDSPGHWFDLKWGFVWFLEYHLRGKSWRRWHQGLSWSAVPDLADKDDEGQMEAFIEEIKRMG